MTAAELNVESLAPNPAAYLQLARQIQGGQFSGLRELRVSVLSTVSAQLLQPFLIVRGAALGFQVIPTFAPIGHLEVAALDAENAIYAPRPDAIVVLARLEEMVPPVFERFAFSGEELSALFEMLAQRLHDLLHALRERTSAALFVANFAPPEYLLAGMGDALREASQVGLVEKMNLILAEACRAVTGAFVFDYARLAAEQGLRSWFDARMFAMARQPWSVGAQIAIAGGLTRAMRAALVAPAKCLVLDADNTLWGGIIGEDGMGGIALGDEYPGNVFKGFQRYLRTLKERGVLLALVSKNDEASVREVLQRHPDSILRLEDFAAMRVNWREKSANIEEIAAELNLGLDALVLFDDSAFEREEVRQALPAVTVLNVSTDPLRYIAAIVESPAFDQLAFSVEDQQRAKLYQERQQRAEAQRSARSPEEFLASLEMRATIGPVGPETLPRVAQLLAKTNQFNLTTRRHTAAQIAQTIDDGAVALWLRLADRFGDHGLVGVAIACPSDEAWSVDTFLLSCRVIGRGVETALLSELEARVRGKGADAIAGEYVPTEKNRLVETFFPAHGFASSGGFRWHKSLLKATVAPHYIEVQIHE